jgi:hypothetical protein
MKIWLPALMATAVAGGAAAQARDAIVESLEREPPGFQTAHLSKATLGAAEILLLSHAAIEPDCAPTEPQIPLIVKQPPEHGSVRASEGLIYISYPPGNSRSACNNRKVPGDQVFYKAARGFRGHDVVVLDMATIDGHVREVTIDIEVR